jgi:2-C-methyl-D-erythritol 4-phosphate cytidylyltransferase/2-C-methyl-D-erythritol 2,4-cyclodiphosphate synthase
MKIGAIIVAGGKGTRAGGDLPKQLWKLGSRPLYRWSVETFLEHNAISQIVLVVPELEASLYDSSDVLVTHGGDTRSASVRAGLSRLSLGDGDYVLIHDAARPGLSNRVIDDLIAALAEADAAAPALVVSDALKRVEGERLRTVDRNQLYRVQTPQAFRFDAIKTALSTGDDLVDDLAAIEAQNGTVRLVDGEERLAKITFPEDFERMERLLLGARPPRLGTGFDVHAFEDGDGVTLCGVTIPHSKKLAGHSDADVAWHALTDAILGAAALGDIGDHFPPSDPQWSGADSAVFLEHAVKIAADAGFELTSCDLTVICEAPKVKPHREAMRARTAEVTGLPISAVSVKATTTEGLGFTGRGEGSAAQASAVLSPTR